MKVIPVNTKKTGEIVVAIDNVAAESPVNRLLHSEARHVLENGRKVRGKWVVVHGVEPILPADMV